MKLNFRFSVEHAGTIFTFILGIGAGIRSYSSMNAGRGNRGTDGACSLTSGNFFLNLNRPYPGPSHRCRAGSSIYSRVYFHSLYSNHALVSRAFHSYKTVSRQRHDVAFRFVLIDPRALMPPDGKYPSMEPFKRQIFLRFIFLQVFNIRITREVCSG